MANYPFFKDNDESRIAYIRKVQRDALPEDIRDQTLGMDSIYSIHAADGQVLALVDDRKKAFVVARMNQMQPLSVH